uniref:Fucosyltransferase n=1 Tax=Paramormyrops kingsleyae TaxID=1676925 RepID=A0A3B3SWE3_9TELE
LDPLPQTSLSMKFRRILVLFLVFLFIFHVCFNVYVKYNSSNQHSNKLTAPPPMQITDSSTQIIVLVWLSIFRPYHKLQSCAALFNITNCLITTDRKVYSKAHGLVIHHRDIRNDLSNLPSMVRPPFQKWVWMNFESNWNPAHERVKFYNLLKEHINISLFGRVTKYLTNQEYVSTVSSCKFYLSFENSKHKDYITEKLYKPLDLGTVPIVLGPPREQYENIVPGDAFIHVDDFLSPKELASRLHFLDENETEYHRYFEWKRHLKVKYVNFPIEHACRACDYLKKHSDEYSSFDNLNQWYWG